MQRATFSALAVLGSFVAASTLAQPAPARGRRLPCGTRSLSAEEKQHADETTRERIAARGAMPRDPGSVSIKVWVHVVNQGTGLTNGDVPDTMIAAQIDVLNDSFAGGTGGANTPFRFTLAGVTRRTNPTLFTTCQDSGARAALTAVRVGGPETLNIYTCKPSSYFGWATFPSNYKWYPQSDGVYLHYGTLPGSTWVPYNTGDTGVHESGHWLGLYHTFEGGCSARNDQVADTPAEKEAHWGCPAGLDSCPQRAGIDPITNFMAYTDDSCMYEFTLGQASRMDAQHAAYR